VRLRPARSTDAGCVGAILSEFVDGTEWMPRVHTRAEDLAHAGALISRGWVTVAELDGTVSGFCACDGAEVDALYIAARARGRGLGSALLQRLQDRQAHLALWTFQANIRAQSFYRRHGFVELHRTDGARNDEKLPDVRLEWRREAA
jgi:GNAT superfamily N-acetyltransferase